MPINMQTAVSLTHEEAAELVALDIPLHLPSLRHLCPYIARRLAAANHGIVLRNLPALTLAAAQAIAPHRWGLHLTGLISISRDVGDALVEHVGTLEFGTCLKELQSPLLAKRIAKQSKWNIVLDGLESLSPDIARALAYDGPRTDLFPAISLNGLRRLSAESAAELAKAFSSVSLTGLAYGSCLLEEGAGEALAAENAYLERVVLVGDDIAAFLARDYPARLLALGIRSLNRLDENREPITTFLDLDSLTSINPAQATAIAAFGGSRVSLRGLRMLTVEAAAALSGYDQQIEFDPRLTLSPAARAALARGHAEE